MVKEDGEASGLLVCVLLRAGVFIRGIGGCGTVSDGYRFKIRGIGDLYPSTGIYLLG